MNMIDNVQIFYTSQSVLHFDLLHKLSVCKTNPIGIFFKGGILKLIGKIEQRAVKI